jgi:hypothetical protein
VVSTVPPNRAEPGPIGGVRVRAGESHHVGDRGVEGAVRVDHAVRVVLV